MATLCLVANEAGRGWRAGLEMEVPPPPVACAEEWCPSEMGWVILVLPPLLLPVMLVDELMAFVMAMMLKNSDVER